MKKILLSLIFALSLASQAQAQYNCPSCNLNTQSIVDQLQQANTKLQHDNDAFNQLPQTLTQAFTTAINTAMKKMISFMFETVPGIGETIASNSSVGILEGHQASETKKTTNTLTNYFTGVDNTTGKMIENTDDITLAFNDAIKASNTDANGLVSSNLSANDFLGTTKYSDAQAINAKNYITLASGAGITITPPDQSDPSSSKTQADMAKYENEYNTIAAVQALNAYNLSSLYAERLGMNVADIPSLSDTGKTSISSAELFRYLAMHKATDPTWYQSMATASPFTNIRELLNFASGSFMMLYRIEQTQEQILATLSELNTLIILQDKDKLS